MGRGLERAASLSTTDVAGGIYRPPRLSRRVNRTFRRKPTLGLVAILTPPVAWLLVIYIGSLILLGFSAFFALDPVSQKPTTTFTTREHRRRLHQPDVRSGCSPRRSAIAATVTLGCVLLALPTAFFVAKIAPRWIRRGLVVSMLLPLWAGYMVKTYAWRAMVAPAGGNKFAAEGRGGGGF